jgi:hypothetical protein
MMNNGTKYAGMSTSGSSAIGAVVTVPLVIPLFRKNVRKRDRNQVSDDEDGEYDDKGYSIHREWFCKKKR